MKCSFEDERYVAGGRWRLSGDGYAVGSYQGFSGPFHRLVCQTPESVDHINRDRLDNRRSNLRPATPRVQVINRVLKTDKELPAGVTLVDGRYVSYYRVNGKTITEAFSIRRYGRALALQKALDARLAHICVEHDYADALISKEPLQKLLAEEAKGFDVGQDLGKAVLDASKRGLNVWKILYGGRYADLTSRNAFRNNQEAALSELFETMRDAVRGVIDKSSNDKAFDELSSWREQVLSITVSLAERNKILVHLPSWSVEEKDERDYADEIRRLEEERKKIEEEERRIEEERRKRRAEEERRRVEEEKKRVEEEKKRAEEARLRKEREERGAEREKREAEERERVRKIAEEERRKAEEEKKRAEEERRIEEERAEIARRREETERKLEEERRRAEEEKKKRAVSLPGRSEEEMEKLRVVEEGVSRVREEIINADFERGVSMLERLEKGVLKVEEEKKERKHRRYAENESVAKWVEERCEKVDGECMTVERAVLDYTSWSSKKKLKPEGRNKFLYRMRELKVEKVTKSVLEGLRLKVVERE